MGKKEKQVKRVVLDTGILVSALLFRGELSKIVGLWQKEGVIPVISKETFNELRKKVQGQACDIGIEENGGDKFLMLVIENRFSSIGRICCKR